ncbi:MAG TPA: hypothetical protein VK862_15610, partial [Afifellaceae bacterium]|nr:hypothetical protein [Afifellaceae bacterium]
MQKAATLAPGRVNTILNTVNNYLTNMVNASLQPMVAGAKKCNRFIRGAGKRRISPEYAQGDAHGAPGTAAG